MYLELGQANTYSKQHKYHGIFSRVNNLLNLNVPSYAI